MSILVKKINKHFIFYDKDIGINIEELFLKNNFHQEQVFKTGIINNGKWFLKHYVRKGLMKFFGDRYLNTSIKKTRPYLEFFLLNDLYKKKFPTCKPIMGWITKDKYTYRANLISEYIPSVNLKTYIEKNMMNDNDWYLIGALVSSLHRLNIFHGDLNITNILVNDSSKNNEKFALVDFDKSKNKDYLTVKEKSSNIDRILRSLKKNNLYNKNGFDLLIKGYSFTND